jgi:hypothetical protein
MALLTLEQLDIPTILALTVADQNWVELNWVRNCKETFQIAVSLFLPLATFLVNESGHNKVKHHLPFRFYSFV